MLTGKIPKGRPFSPIRYGGKTALSKEQKKLMTKAEKRMLEWSSRETSTAAKSAAHLGVIDKPSEQNVSKLLEIRRAQAQGHGTSVKRLKTWWEKEENTNTEVGKKNSEEEEIFDPHNLLKLKPKIVIPKPKKNQFGDLEA